MQSDLRWLLYGAFTLLLVSGCDLNSPWGSSGTGSDYGSNTAAAGRGSTGGSGATGNVVKPGVGGESTINGADDSVIATPSVAGVSVATGASQTIGITFTSSDGLAITGFEISGSLGNLPTGWSGPSTFACSLVSAGSGCVLNLTYAPTAVDSGSLVINYVYIDNANIPRAPGGTLTIPYAATATNNIVAAASPTGQINAIVGAGAQAVSVNFTTDDGNAATNLALTTSLGALPSGWSSMAPGLSCAIVSSGSGCQLALDYAPAAAVIAVIGLGHHRIAQPLGGTHGPLGGTTSAGAGARDRNPDRVHLPHRLRDRSAPDQRRQPQLLPAGKEHAAGPAQTLESSRLLRVSPGIEFQRRHALRPHVAEKTLVTRAGTARHARRGYDRDVRAIALGHLACTHAPIPLFADAIMPSRREGFSDLPNRGCKERWAELSAAG